jgi:hypothetical protein
LLVVFLRLLEDTHHAARIAGGFQINHRQDLGEGEIGVTGQFPDRIPLNLEETLRHVRKTGRTSGGLEEILSSLPRALFFTSHPDGSTFSFFEPSVIHDLASLLMQDCSGYRWI